MASGLLMLLDDIATILDDIALLTKVAAKKTAGVLGDDLALNAQQVSGVQANRELPVVWAVAKGSLLNKCILVPVALLLSWLAPWAITPLLILGGLYLCFEGCEKIVHKFLQPADAHAHDQELQSAVADSKIDLVSVEREKIRGAIRTDFVLSAEIVVITLGTVAKATLTTQLIVLCAISLLMTVGVYGLVACIVKLDDIGVRLLGPNPPESPQTVRQRVGWVLVGGTPYLMKFLSIAGTIAMFLVGGGILSHGVPAIHHAVEALVHPLAEIESLGRMLSSVGQLIVEGLLGILAGFFVILLVALVRPLFMRPQHSP
ncbi:MAG: DUF808 domain-containing protein [Aureliella sp.]